MWYTYVLLSLKDREFYIGSAKNLKQRIFQHNNGECKATKYRGPLRLIYYEACLSKNDMRAREKYLKSGMGQRYLKNRLKNSFRDF